MDRYDSYKDSGVERLGEIPSHWNTPYIKNLVETKITDGPHLTPKFIDEGGIPFLSVESIQNSKIDLSRRRGNISVEDHIDYSKKCKPQWNDILLVKSASVGKLTIVDIEDEFNIWSPLSLIRIKKNGNPKYFYYFFHTDYFQTLLKLNSGINTQPNIGMGVIENLKVVSPPLPEQQQIVSFLDTKTSLIDSLIEKTQRKIELLKEKRTSLINEVVTKGLNPNVEMKDSGVEWIGEIPSHWELKKTKHILSKDKYSLVDGPFGSNLKSIHYVENGDVYIIESGFVTSGKFKLVREFKTITYEHFETIKRSECFEGCIIMSKIGEYYGMTGVLPKLDKPSVVSGNSISIKISDSFNTNFIHKLLLQHWENGTFKKEVQQTGQPFISMTMVNNIVFPIPPFEEQQQIVEYLDEQTQLIDKTISIEEKRIELLKEYRQSLISEVVTGKIDVRVN